jgi:hypothetical protein
MQYRYGLDVIAETWAWLIMVAFLIGIAKLRALYVIPSALGLLALWWLLTLKSRVLTPLREYREANRRVKEFHDAVATAETARVHCVESDACVEVNADEAYFYFFDVGGNQTYLIDTYGMLPGESATRWPNRKFEVIEIPGWKKEMGPFCYGKRLRPREILDARDLFEHCNFELHPLPSDGIINQSLDDFLRDARVRNRSAGGASATL